MNDDHLFQGFDAVEFSSVTALVSLRGRPQGGFVYAIFWRLNGIDTPFYVGQTLRLAERMGDYCWADFKAPTDFRIGEAIRYFRDIKNYSVQLKYRRSEMTMTEERFLIRSLHLLGILLLNDFGGYDYRSAQPEEERRMVHLFCEALLKNVK